MESITKYVRVILNIIFPVAVTLVICLIGPKLMKFFWPFVVGWLIAMIANPLVRFLDKRLNIVRKHSSMMIVVAVLAVIIGVLYLVISKLTIELIGFTKDLPRMYESFTVEIKNIFGQFEQVFDLLPSGIQDFFNEFVNNIGSYLSMVAQKAASPTVEVAGNVARGIPNLLVNVIITILSSYFFIAEKDKIMDVVQKHIPDGTIQYFEFLRKETRHLIGGYFLAQFRIMFVIALVLAAGFLVLDIKYGLLFAILIAILDFLPLFGTGTALIPWAVIRLFSKDYAVAVGLLLLYVLTQVLRQIIQPKIVGDTMGLPPMLTLIFLYLGFKAKGIAGMILAVPVGLLALNLFKYGVYDNLIKNVKILIHDINEFRKKG